MADFYVKDAAKHRQKLRHLKPETAQAFAKFSEIVFKDGALSGKVKNLIAIAVAHVTQCPWCIDGHCEEQSDSEPPMRRLPRRSMWQPKCAPVQP
jgi:alkylhydroperoxidase/carboxymuconolactone decarboxylase family protein YurZ